MKIPIARPDLGRQEIENVSRVLESGWVTQGPKVEEFENAFARYVGTDHAVAVSSCTTGLHLALMAVGTHPGDVVITVSHSFVATANAVRHCGAEPIFVDVERKGFNMDVDALGAVLREQCEQRGDDLYLKNAAPYRTSTYSPLRRIDERCVGRVAAVLAVHQLGFPCKLEAMSALCKEYQLPLVEDAACAIGSDVATQDGPARIGGVIGDVQVFSFHPRKVITTGEGGMVTTHNEALASSMRLFRHHGMTISDVTRHKAKKYEFSSYVAAGYNYRLSDIHAAVGLAQLAQVDEFIRARRALADQYKSLLEDLSWLETYDENSDDGRANWQSYPIWIAEDAPVPRDELMQRLLSDGVATRPGITNAHEEPPYAETAPALPHSEAARRHTLMLPMYPSLTSEQVDRVCRLLREAGKA